MKSVDPALAGLARKGLEILDALSFVVETFIGCHNVSDYCTISLCFTAYIFPTF